MLKGKELRNERAKFNIVLKHFTFYFLYFLQSQKHFCSESLKLAPKQNILERNHVLKTFVKVSKGGSIPCIKKVPAHLFDREF